MSVCFETIVEWKPHCIPSQEKKQNDNSHALHYLFFISVII